MPRAVARRLRLRGGRERITIPRRTRTGFVRPTTATTAAIFIQDESQPIHVDRALNFHLKGADVRADLVVARTQMESQCFRATDGHHEPAIDREFVHEQIRVTDSARRVGGGHKHHRAHPQAFTFDT